MIAVDVTLATRGASPTVGTFEAAVDSGRARMTAASDLQVCDVRAAWNADDLYSPAGPGLDAAPLGKPFFAGSDGGARRSPTRSTQAQFRIVGYQLTDLHTVMVARCRAATSEWPQVWVVPGPGGTGKTRLASEVAAVMEAEGWTTVLARRPDDVTPARVGAVRGCLFLVVDYADAFDQASLEQIVAAVAGPRRGPAVVVLLARTAGPWWGLLDGALVAGRVDVQPHVFEPLTAPTRSDGADLWRAACSGFADWFEVDLSSIPAPPRGDRWTALDLVLLAWLSVNPQASAALPATRTALYDEVLEHELRHWPQGVSVARDDWRRWAAHLSVAAPDHRLVAAAVVPDASVATRDAFARVWAGSWHDERTVDAVALRPDAVGDHLVRSYFSDHPGELGELMTRLAVLDGHGGDESPVARAIANLARAATDTDVDTDAPARVGRMLGAVLAHDEALWRPVFDQALSGSAAAAAAVLDAVERADLEQRNGLDLVRGVASRAPVGHAVVSGLACRAAERWQAAGVPEAPEERAARLGLLSVRLVEVGRRLEALVAGREAVEIRRGLTERDPDTFSPELALSLNTLANLLSEVGYREEALGTAEEAVAIYRRLTAMDPGTFSPELASSLNNLAVRLAEVGRREEAMDVAQEAVGMSRRIVGSDPTFLPDLASSLSTLANRLVGVGRREEALDPAQEAVAIRRRLVGQSPAMFLPGLASSLNNVAIRLAGVGRREEALGPAEEAVAIYERLEEVNPLAFSPRLASSLENLALRLSEVGRREEALAVAEEAVMFRRRLVEEDPGAFLSDLASSLNNVGIRLVEVGRQEEALAVAQEAVAIYRRLVEENPGTFLPDLASSLNNAGNLLAEVGRREEALGPAQEAVTIRRRLVEENPGAFLPDLASSLNNVAIRLVEVGRREESLGPAEEAVAIYRRLVEENPGAFLPVLAASLNTLGNRSVEVGRREEALAVAQEAVTIRRRLVEENPGAFLPDLALSLNNVAIRLSGVGRREESLGPAQEAVAIYRRLVEENPGAFLPDLAASLNNLGNRLVEVGRREEALAVAQEAVAIRRRLVEENPGAFLPGLASSLNNLANLLSEVGRQEEGLAVAQEAVAIRRRSVEENPGAFLPDLASSLNNLGNRLVEVGRREEGLAVAQEAVAIRRRLVEGSPGAFLPDLASSLNNVASLLVEVGRREEALAVAQEAVAIRRRLVEENTRAFLPDLASSLNNLANLLSEVGRQEEGLAVAQEAVAIRRRLVEENTRAFLPDLLTSLLMLTRLGPDVRVGRVGRGRACSGRGWSGVRVARRHARASRASCRRPLAGKSCCVGRPSGWAPRRAGPGTAVRDVVAGQPDEVLADLPDWASTAIDDTAVDRANGWLQSRTWIERRAWLDSARAIPGEAEAMAILLTLYPEASALAVVVEVLAAADPAAAIEELVERGEEFDAVTTALREWLATATWDESRRYFVEHRDELSSDLARQMLIDVARDRRDDATNAQHRALLDLVDRPGIGDSIAFTLPAHPARAVRLGLDALSRGTCSWSRCSSSPPPPWSRSAVTGPCWPPCQGRSQPAHRLMAPLRVRPWRTSPVRWWPPTQGRPPWRRALGSTCSRPSPMSCRPPRPFSPPPWSMPSRVVRRDPQATA